VKIITIGDGMKEVKCPQMELGIRGLEANPASLIQIFYGMQQGIGYLPKESLRYVSDKVKAILLKVYSIMISRNLF